jgi:hypothetical protein
MGNAKCKMPNVEHTVRNLIRAALFPQKVGGSTKNRTLFKLVRNFH